MTVHAPFDPVTGLLPCCGSHYLSHLFGGDSMATEPDDVINCKGDGNA